MGAAILALSATKAGAKKSLIGLLSLMAFALVFWLRGDLMGLLTAVLIVGILALLLRAKDWPVQEVVQFIGLFLCMTSLQAVLQTLRITPVAMGENDAEILQKATGIPAILSATLWAGISIGVAWMGLKRAWAAR
jgi:hypothetical protein